MMNALRKSRNTFLPEPVLTSILLEAKIEHRQMEEMFSLLGWSDLPQELKIEIKDDVKGYIDELEGNYCSSCSFVQRRRESVDFWVSSFKEQICTLETALQALRANKLK